ncbi:hypothetical protein PYCCODRAFT_1478180 [Trametes coccinea BRFM310]|uniref:F-box domain-containing protein n=1 Tax=Trametes coccinea (strain BRFM310) TaxID=1353009 RepID=A0A1Y2IKQ6_TRAC3|nr:hypothetical protein PYCCODRAFT_1478180 [Trametes coccinea BRFM310]
MARGRRMRRTATKIPKGHILSLPPNILKMIFDRLSSHTNWLASAATVCKAFQEAIEPILYRVVSLHSCAKAKIFCQSVAKDSTRAQIVRKLELHLLTGKGTSIKGPLKRALGVLVNLTHLSINVDDPTVFDLLRGEHTFRLRALCAGGEHYPSESFLMVLHDNPTIEYLRLQFKVDLLKERPTKFQHHSSLQKLRALSVDPERFPVTLFQYPYPIQYLSLGFSEPSDVRHALKLFDKTLVFFRVNRYLDGMSVTRPWLWPTAVLRKLHLPKLQHLEVIDHCDRKNDELPPIGLKDMQVPNMREVCPKLKTIVWGAASLLQTNLYIHPVRGSEESLLDIYARELFASSKLERMGVFIHTLGIHLDEEDGHLFVRGKSSAMKSSSDNWEAIPIKRWRGKHDITRFWMLDFERDDDDDDIVGSDSE